MRTVQLDVWCRVSRERSRHVKLKTSSYFLFQVSGSHNSPIWNDLVHLDQSIAEGSAHVHCIVQRTRFALLELVHRGKGVGRRRVSNDIAKGLYTCRECLEK